MKTNKETFNKKLDALLFNMTYLQIKEIKDFINMYIDELESKINNAKEILGCDGMCGATDTWETMSECRNKNSRK